MTSIAGGEKGKNGKRHERLKSWSACHAVALAVYRVTQRWPSHEAYGLTSQARKAAYSASANIAEGAAKRGNAEFRRFLNISLGSLAELSYILLLARDLDYLKPNNGESSRPFGTMLDG
jgi:four helix bundle protein